MLPSLTSTGIRLRTFNYIYWVIWILFSLRSPMSLYGQFTSSLEPMGQSFRSLRVKKSHFTKAVVEDLKKGRRKKEKGIDKREILSVSHVQVPVREVK